MTSRLHLRHGGVVTSSLITPAQLADASLGRVPASSPGLSGWIERASDVVRDVCGWHIAGVETHTVIMDTRGGRSLVLPTLRLVAPPVVAVDGEVMDLDGWSPRGMVETRKPLPRRLGAVQVTMTHGYDTVPGAVASAVASVVLASWASPLGRTQEAVGSISASYGTAGGQLTVSDAVRRVLGPYMLSERP